MTPQLPTPIFRARSRRPLLLSVLLLSALLASGCGYNAIQAGDEEVKAAWSEVSNQYQRRADLIPNLVSTVKGAADFERGTLEAVVEARARATSIQATPELINDPVAFEKFMQAQGQLGGALSRLLATFEGYPQLQATAGFRDLQAQIEGIENRITVARGRYIDSVKAFNTQVRQFPTNLTARAFGYSPKAQFEARADVTDTPPQVEF